MIRLKLEKLAPNIVCWTLAIFGLIWQVYQVSSMFFGYQTRVDIEIEAPMYLSMPAMTICLELKPKLETLSHLLPGRNFSAFNIKKDYLNLPINILSQLETVDVKIDCWAKYPQVKNSKDGKPCKNFAKTLTHLQYRSEWDTINRCTTYFYRNATQDPYMVTANEAKDFYFVHIYSAESNDVCIYVHDPVTILNLDESDFFIVSTNQASEMVISSSKITIRLLPSPYYTNCRTYDDKMFGRYGCIFNCHQKKAFDACRTWPTEVPAPLWTPLPFLTRGKPYPQLDRNECTNFRVCPRQCDNVHYTSSLVWNYQKNEPSNLTKLFIRRPFGVEFVYIVTPNLALVEYSCYIASSIGIWFGISCSDMIGLLIVSTEDRIERKQSLISHKTAKPSTNRLNLTWPKNPTGNSRPHSSRVLNSRLLQLLARLKPKSHEKMKQIRAKIVSWGIATIGLIWQIQKVSVIYFEYPTRVDIEVDLPQNITIPGLTVCLELKENRSVFRKHFPKENVNTSNIVEFYSYLPISVLQGMETVDQEIICRTPFPELSKIDPNGGDECENYVTPRVSIQYGWENNRVYKCKTFFYQEPNSPPRKVIRSGAKDFYQVEFRAAANYSANIFIHNPSELLHFIEADNFIFWPHQVSEMILSSSKVTTSLMPFPYRTDCVDYGDTPFGRVSCVYSCRQKLVKENCPTWPHDVPADLPTDEAFAIQGRYCKQPNRHLCSDKKICKSQCVNPWYVTTLISNQEKRSPSPVSKLFVRRPFGAELVYNYGPRLAQIEFICYVASCLGIWFGLSFTDIIQFALLSGEKRLAEYTGSNDLGLLKLIRTIWHNWRNNRCAISKTFKS